MTATALTGVCVAVEPYSVKFHCQSFFTPFAARVLHDQRSVESRSNDGCARSVAPLGLLALLASGRWIPAMAQTVAQAGNKPDSLGPVVVTPPQRKPVRRAEPGGSEAGRPRALRAVLVRKRPSPVPAPDRRTGDAKRRSTATSSPKSARGSVLPRVRPRRRSTSSTSRPSRIAVSGRRPTSPRLRSASPAATRRARPPSSRCAALPATRSTRSTTASWIGPSDHDRPSWTPPISTASRS